MTPDVCIVGGERHQKVDQGQDDQSTGGGGNQEHHLQHHHHRVEHLHLSHLSPLHKVNAELLDLLVALHQHVDALRPLREQEVEGVEVNTASIPLYLLCATHT